MNKINLIITGISLMIMLAGCSKTETYGETITGNLPEVSIKEILETPEKFENKSVTLEGNIKEVCPAGCWFFVEDEHGELYVNIGPSGFAIPNKTGHKVKIEGEVITHNGSLMLLGKGVEIK